jgi:hypothetical protein
MRWRSNPFVQGGEDQPSGPRYVVAWVPCCGISNWMFVVDGMECGFVVLVMALKHAA